MSVYSNIRDFTHRHEWVGDLFSVLAVLLLFGTVWAVLEYNSLILVWIRQDVIIHVPLAALAIGVVIFVIIAFLSIGSASHGPEDRGSFHTFRGRRHGGASIYGAFRNWLHHMEHVGKKHR